MRYTLKNWTALTRYCEDEDLALDNNATERAIRGVAVGRNKLRVLWQRPRRPDGSGAAKLCGFLPTSWDRPFPLVRGRPVPHRRPPDHPARRTSAAHLGVRPRSNPKPYGKTFRSLAESATHEASSIRMAASR